MSTHNYLDNTTARLELLGIPNILSSFSQFNSASRVSMFNHHLSQSMILNNPEFNKLFTGVENKLIDYTFNRSRRKFDCEIVAIIPKYEPSILPKGMDYCPQIYVITLTIEPGGVQHLDYFEINRYFLGSNGFGFIPQMENHKRIRVGEVLDKETPLTHSPAVIGNQYAMGTNLNIVYGSFPETIEDAFIISESAAKKLQTEEVKQMVIDCRQDRRPLNLHGDQWVDKFLPDIGSQVRPDGALCAFRPIHWTTCVADSDPEALREPLPLQDDIKYVEPGARIVDLTFNINRSKLNNCYDQAEAYMRNNTKCWEAIYATYLKYKGKFKLTQEMSTLVRTAIFRIIAQGGRPPTLENEFSKVMRKFDIEGANRQVVDFLQAIVTYTVPRAVHNGDKLTDLQGAKGVIGKIYPDDWMPIDEYGIRADMWVDMNSPVGRNNPGQLYETGINRISLFAQAKIKEEFESKGAEVAFETMMDWYNDVNPNYARLVREKVVTSQEKRILVKESVETSLKIWIPPFLDTLTPNDTDFWNALTNIKKWQIKWGAYSSRIRYKSLQADGTGKEFISNELFAIGSKYILHLHKIPEIFAPGPAAVNNIGIPTRSTFETKHFPVSTNPYKYGEDELRIMAMDTDIREVVRFQNLMSNSPIGAITSIESILLADKPTRITRMPISNGELLKTSSVLNLFHNITAVLGVQTKSTKIDAFEVPDELTESIYDADLMGEKAKPISIFTSDESVTRRSDAKRSKMKKVIEAMGDDDDDD